MLHPQGSEDVFSKISIEGLAAHVLDNLAEGGEAGVAVHPFGSGLDLHRPALAVVVGKGRRPARPARTPEPAPGWSRPDSRRQKLTPAVWVRRCRTVAGRKPAFAGTSRNALRYSLAGVSRSTRPCSRSCITATAVKVFVMEAIRKTVFSVIGSLPSTVATPWPKNDHLRLPGDR